MTKNLKDRCEGCQYDKNGKCKAISPSDCANNKGSIYTTPDGRQIFAKNDADYLDIIEEPYQRLYGIGTKFEG